MKNKKLIILLSAAAALFAALAVTVAAVYDSSEDPLISLSYLKNIFKPEILDAVDERIETLEERIGSYEREDESNGKEFETEEIYTPIGEDKTSSATYEVVELKNGDAIYAVTACDIMLRSGTAVCIAPDANQGIADYTSAEEIYNGMSFVKNHMCLIPRGDGRGLLATSESVFVMIRGDYTIVSE